MMISFLISSMLLNNIVSQITVPGSQIDDNNCVTDGGYSWCPSTRSCMRMWETPCPDNYSDCKDCVTKQSQGINIACPRECDMTSLPHPPIIAIDPVPPPTPMLCPEVMCMMYCENGHRLDQNGCQLCDCNEMRETINDNCEIEQPSCDQYTYICPRIREITACSEGGISGYTTYQLSIILKEGNMIKNIFAIYGNAGETLIIPPSFNINSIFGSNVGGVSPDIIAINPDSRFDSWITIGEIDGNINNEVDTIGISFNDWDEKNGITVMNGAIFLMNPDKEMNIGAEIVVGQFTIKTGNIESVIMNFQGKYTEERIHVDIGDNSWKETHVEFILDSNNLNNNQIPIDCILWYDGCNQCRVNNGVLGACSRVMCFTEDDPRCLNYIDSGH